MQVPGAKLSYSNITFLDKNPIKRWLQRKRLISAIKILGTSDCAKRICDFGAGNGELCKGLAEKFPAAKIICYEPTPSLLLEARENLREFGERIEFCSDAKDLENQTFDIILCLEVFEHLPKIETISALKIISEILHNEGKFVIGVPVEVGIPAVYKGLFRMIRRYGAFDANIKNVFLALIGYPPVDRPVSEISPGLSFYFEHMGFNHKILAHEFLKYFKLVGVSTSPFGKPISFLMPEINYLLINTTKVKDI